MNAKFRSVCVLGLGYIGLPTCAIFANRGLKVIGVDVRSEVVETINQGRIHIEEPGLGVAVHAAVSSGNFRAHLAPQVADAYIIAVPTPFRENHQPDLSYVDAAAESVASVVQRGALVILESTSPPGTTQRVADAIAERTGLKPGTDIQYAHCPERVLPGRTMEELISNDRIIGGLSPESAKRAKDLYATFVQGQILLTDARTAEFTKLVENTFRDVNIALANELSMVADKLGIDPWEAIRLANHHPRVRILSPGPGVGGHCIPVDPWFIVAAAPAEARLIRTAREVNDAKSQFVERQILSAAARAGSHAVRERRGDGRGEVLLLGLAYKADVDDFRESPALEIARHVTGKLGHVVAVHDPYLQERHHDGLHPVEDLDEALERARVVVLLTDHRPYRELERARLTGKEIIDTRGAWSGRQ